MSTSRRFRLRLATAAVVLPLLMAAACGRAPSNPTPPPTPSGPPILLSIKLDGPARTAPGSTPVQYSAMAEFSDGTNKDVTRTALWDPMGVSGRLIAPGAVTLSGRGRATLSATYKGKTGLLTVSVLEAGTFILTGIVNESAQGPLDVATVDVVSGTGMGISVTSDVDGRFAVFGVAGTVQIRASRSGYTPQVRDVIINADAAIEPLSLAPIGAPRDLAGRWTMTLTPGPGCRAGLPDLALGRTYSVQFLGQPSSFIVRTSGPTLEVHDAGGDRGSTVGSDIEWVFVGDTAYGDWSWANLIDHISPTETFQFDGIVTGTVSGDDIRATFQGDLMYWNTRIPSDKPTWYCRAPDHVAVLKRLTTEPLASRMQLP